MAKALKTRDASLPRQAGERARLKVIQGPDVGAIFVLTSSRVTVGRGDENELTLLDLKASRKHFELSEANGAWILTDAGSANGTVLNGTRATSGPIRTGDLIQLGETIMEFMGADTPTVMLTAPPRDLAQLQHENAQFEAQRRKVQAMALGRPAPLNTDRRVGGGSGALTSILSRLGGFAQSGGPGQNASPNPASKRILIYGVLGLAVGWVYLGNPSGGGGGRRPANQAQGISRAGLAGNDQPPDRSLSSYLPQGDSDPKAKQAAEIFFRDGFREYARKNYLRARAHFETALQVYPGHPQARRFLDESEAGIKKLVKTHLKRGKRNLETGRLRDAKVDYETVLRTLYREPLDPAYLEATDQLEKVKKAMRSTSSITAGGGR